MVKDIFESHRNFIWLSAGQPEPDGQTFQKLMSPIVEKLEKMSNFKQSKKSGQYFNHLSAVADGLQALGWVSVVIISRLLKLKRTALTGLFSSFCIKISQMKIFSKSNRPQ